MIVKMNRISLIVASSEKEQALTHLADAQVFHTGALEVSTDQSMQLQREISRLDGILTLLPSTKIVDRSQDGNDLDSYIDKVVRTHKALKEAQDDVLRCQRQAEAIEAWGDFSPCDIEHLATEGHFIRLYTMDKQLFITQQALVNSHLFVCRAKGSEYLVAAYSKNEVDFPKLDPIELPAQSAKSLRDEAVEARTNVITFGKVLLKLAEQKHLIENRMRTLSDSLQFEKVSASMSDEGEIALIEGFIPQQDVTTFKELAHAHGWAILVAPAETGDEAKDEVIPTKIKSSFFGKFVYPLLAGFDFVPGYKEFDISGPMFFFFAIFFAMIIGDAAYGSIFFLVAMVIAIKTKKNGKMVNPFIFYLMFLSLCTIVWGVLTDNWFGFSIGAEVPTLGQFKRKELLDMYVLMFISFAIGAVHLIYARLWAFVRKLKVNIKGAPAELGSVAMIIGLFYIINMLILRNQSPVLVDGALPTWILPMIIVGFASLLIFSGQERGVNFFKGIGTSLSNAFPITLGAVGNFSDIVSYIRLFAVGFAGVTIAKSFNDIANGLPFVAAIIILILAHTLNITLAILSIVVHALRLNSLEFSTHLGLQWTGNSYKPFKEKRNVWLSN
jgi:V/A-type H+-transporting ATPase subunit I